MIDDLRTNVKTYKYVDDTTLYKITNNPEDDGLQSAVNHVTEWSKMNHMKLNASKTKEMLISFARNKPDVPNICVNDVALERVDCVTLLGVKLCSDLSWHRHVEYIIKKAQSRLFCLNLLRRSKVSPKDIIMIFQSRIRPILEYAAPVWHGGLSNELSDAIEDQQKRAFKIAFPYLDYDQALLELSMKTLHERRIKLCSSFFTKIEDPRDKLYHLLPEQNDPSIVTREAKLYPLPLCHTNRYKNSFIPYALFNCQ